MKVLIVDDSVTFRSQIKSVLSAVEGIEVVGIAADGKIAIEKMQNIDVELVTLDLEMPKMNGLETIRELKRIMHKARIIVFAAESDSGASLALEALRMGADDFVAKPVSRSLEESLDKIGQDLVPKILQFRKAMNLNPLPQEPWEPETPIVQKKIKIADFVPKVVVIGSSTGGPNALEHIFKELRPPIFKPVIIVQHMPPVFTDLLAKRIQALSGIPTMEVKQWTPLLPSKIYVAPGNYHLRLFQKNENEIFLRLDQSPLRNNVRPAVDSLFESAAEIFGPHVLSLILTGMGEDGLVGARAIKAAGGAVLIQDKETSVVFGMPGAIYNAGIYDEMAPLESIGNTLKKALA